VLAAAPAAPITSVGEPGCHLMQGPGGNSRTIRSSYPIVVQFMSVSGWPFGTLVSSCVGGFHSFYGGYHLRQIKIRYYRNS
jgi:hypothetical protein